MHQLPLPQVTSLVPISVWGLVDPSQNDYINKKSRWPQWSVNPMISEPNDQWTQWSVNLMISEPNDQWTQWSVNPMNSEPNDQWTQWSVNPQLPSWLCSAATKCATKYLLLLFGAQSDIQLQYIKHNCPSEYHEGVTYIHSNAEQLESHSGHFNPTVKPTGTHWIGEWVAPEWVWMHWRGDKSLVPARDQTMISRPSRP
jgi:hypothetical protein